MANKIKTNIELNVSGDGKVSSAVKKVNESVTKATGSVTDFTKKLSAINYAAKLSSVVNSFSIIKGTVSATASIVKGMTVGVFNFVDKYASSADRMNKFSRAVGFSVVDLQKWQYAARRGGVENEQFNKSLVKFEAAVSKAANGERAYLDVFNALGVRVKSSNGAMRANSDIMLDVADAYSKITNAQDKIGVNEKLFGKSGLGLVNVLEGGSAGVSELLRKREELGGLVTDEDARKAEEFKDLLENVQTMFGSIGKSIAAKLLPTFNKLFNKIMSWWTSNGSKVLSSVGTLGESLSKAVMALVEQLPTILNSATWLLDKFVGIADTIGIGKLALISLVPLMSGTLLTATNAFVAALGGGVGNVSKMGGLLGKMAGKGGVIDLIGLGIIGWGTAFNSFKDNWDLWKNTSLKEVLSAVKELTWVSKVNFTQNAKEQEREALALSMQNAVPKFVSRDYSKEEEEIRKSFRPSAMSDVSNVVTNNAKLTIDFKNLPKGTNVKQSGDMNFFQMNTGYVFE